MDLLNSWCPKNPELIPMPGPIAELSTSWNLDFLTCHIHDFHDCRTMNILKSLFPDLPFSWPDLFLISNTHKYEIYWISIEQHEKKMTSCIPECFNSWEIPKSWMPGYWMPELMPEFLNAWMAFRHSGIHAFRLNAWMPECQNSWMPECQKSWFVDSGTSEFLNTCIQIPANIRLSISGKSVRLTNNIASDKLINW